MGLTGAFRRLGSRVALFLSVALLPIGLIAVVQTIQAERVSRQRAELTILAYTEQAALAERQQLQKALGTAQALAGAVPSLMATGRCDEVMTRFIAEASRYSTAGYVQPSGLLTCGSGETGHDFSTSPGFDEAISDPRPRLGINRDGPISGQSVLIATYPVLEASGGGFVFVSLPHTRLQASTLSPDMADAVILMTFNAEGEILTSSAGLEDAADHVPAAWDLKSVVGRPADVLFGTDRSGQERTFAVVPIVEGTVYGLGSWERDAIPGGPFGAAVPTWTFPILMWAISLVVAIVAVHRLVIRHMRGLSKRMRDFAEHRQLPDDALGSDAPLELMEMEAAFSTMAERILREEAETENRLHEQKVLLREVHHRVKNNLQLISSIISIQMRQIDSPEIRQVLSRIQDRVLGLATMHRNLVETEAGGIPAHNVLRDIVMQLADMATLDGRISVEFDMDPLEVFPDQAVPLCLFVTEAATNAVKYIGRPGGGERPWLAVSLKRQEDGSVWLSIANSKDAETRQHGPLRDGTGLGSQLIRAFALQLETTPVIEETPGTYRIAIRFRPSGFEGDALPHDRSALEAAQ